MKEIDELVAKYRRMLHRHKVFTLEWEKEHAKLRRMIREAAERGFVPKHKLPYVRAAAKKEKLVLRKYVMVEYLECLDENVNRQRFYRLMEK